MQLLPKIVSDVLVEKIQELEDRTNADWLVIKGPITGELPAIVAAEIEDLNKEGSKKHDSLYVMLTTNGGSAEVAERLVYIFRHHCSEVHFCIPDYAYSAGTILCMSGDSILMDYHSVLGPIDPQVANKQGVYVPALGYLDKINSLIKRAREGEISEAEFYILKDFDLAELTAYEQARDLTIDLLKEWLVKYKFKDWTHKGQTKIQVTDEEKRTRAEEIAKKLSDNNLWHSHGRPLNIEKLTTIGLKIGNLADDQELRKGVKELYILSNENMSASNASAMILTRGGA